MGNLVQCLQTSSLGEDLFLTHSQAQAILTTATGKLLFGAHLNA